VKPVEEIGLPELTPEQQEQLCILAEKAAREYILSKISSRKITTLNITVEIERKKPITVTVETEIQLSPSMKNIDTEKLVKQATQKALQAADKYLRQTACNSTKQ
jgi:GGDEF domain-containing protein